MLRLPVHGFAELHIVCEHSLLGPLTSNLGQSIKLTSTGNVAAYKRSKTQQSAVKQRQRLHRAVKCSRVDKGNA